VAGGRVVAEERGRFELRERHQIGTFQDFCNDCGNCDTFCPEDGGPYRVKPRFFGSRAAFERLTDLEGFHVERHGSRDIMWGRLRRVSFRLEVDRATGRAIFGDGRVFLEAEHGTRTTIGSSASPDAPEGHELDGAAYLAMAAILDGVLDPRRVNPVNA
jgi:putative selenate reductase